MKQKNEAKSDLEKLSQIRRQKRRKNVGSKLSVLCSDVKETETELSSAFFGFARAKHDTRPAHPHLVLPVAGGTWA